MVTEGILTYTSRGSCLYHLISIYFYARGAGDQCQNYGISAQESGMEEIAQELPGHLPDSIAKVVREKLFAEDKVRLIAAHDEGTECKA
jgi:hypothetical protein